MNPKLDEPTGATPLTLDELRGLKAQHITHRGELNELESENIIEGLTWLESRPRSFDILTDETARKVHKRLFGQVWSWAGVYRQTEKNIGVTALHISTEMRSCLDDARYWLENSPFDPLEAAARLHHRLVWIHPFTNGNGRWARIMADGYLSRIDDDIFLDWSGGGALTANSKYRLRYIAALKAADGSEFGPIVGFVRGISQQR